MALSTYAFESELENGLKDALESASGSNSGDNITGFTLYNSYFEFDDYDYILVTDSDLPSLNDASSVLYNGKKQYFNVNGLDQRIIRYDGSNWEIARYIDGQNPRTTVNIAYGSGADTEYPWEATSEAIALGEIGLSLEFINPIGGSFGDTTSSDLNILITDQESAETPSSYVYIETEIGEPISNERTNANGDYDHYEADLSFEVNTPRIDNTTQPNDPNGSSSTVLSYHDYMLTLVRQMMDGDCSEVVSAFDTRNVSIVKAIPDRTDRSKDEDDRTSVVRYRIQFKVK